MAEILDIYDEMMNRVGEMERAETGRHDVWTRFTHCWVVCTAGRGSVVFQKRSPHIERFPGLLTATAGGALGLGETEKDAPRETREELNIDITLDDMVYLGRRIDLQMQAPDKKTKAFVDVFFYPSPKPVEEYRPNVEEVYGLLAVDIAEGIDFFSGKTDSALFRGIEYDEAAKAWHPCESRLTRADFMYRFDNYYLKILIMAERLMQKKAPLTV